MLELFRMLAYLILGIPIPSGPLVLALFLPNSRCTGCCEARDGNSL